MSGFVALAGLILIPLAARAGRATRPAYIAGAIVAAAVFGLGALASDEPTLARAAAEHPENIDAFLLMAEHGPTVAVLAAAVGLGAVLGAVLYRPGAAAR